MQEQLKMHKPLMERLFNIADEDDYIKIDYGNKDLQIPKRFLDYTFFNKGYHLQIINKGNKEIYLIKTDSIDVVTLIKPKFKGMTWYNQGKAKAGA